MISVLEYPECGASDIIPLLGDIMAEAVSQDNDLSYYDPFMGNLCTEGQFVSLPIVATPDGPRGSDLAITLALHKPHQEPCFDLLAPKSTLISFPSPIGQIATLPWNSGTEEFEGNPIRLSFDIDRPFRH
jgi:hypothetical protein